MKRRISVFLLVAFSLWTSNILAQAGGSGTPQTPPPPTVAAIAIEDDNQAAVVLSGTLIVNYLDTERKSKVGFLRNVAQSLLQTERPSIVYRNEVGALLVGNLSDGETAVGEVRYYKRAFDSLEERFFDSVRDFLVTDGKKYFRVVLGTPEGGFPSNVLASAVGGPER